MTKRSPFRYFNTRPLIIRLAVMLYVRFPHSLRNVEDLLHERGIDISHETVRLGYPATSEAQFCTAVLKLRWLRGGAMTLPVFDTKPKSDKLIALPPVCRDSRVWGDAV